MAKKVEQKKVAEKIAPKKNDNPKGLVVLVGTGKFGLKKDKEYKAGEDLANVLVKKGAANYK